MDISTFDLHLKNDFIKDNAVPGLFSRLNVKTRSVSVGSCSLGGFFWPLLDILAGTGSYDEVARKNDPCKISGQSDVSCYVRKLHFVLNVKFMKNRVFS